MKSADDLARSSRANGEFGTTSHAAPSLSRHYRTSEVVQRLGISRRQLQYWAQTGLVAPSATTPGGHRRYAFEDLVALRTAARLIDSGISVQRIRKSIAALRRTLPGIRRPLTELVLVATGDVILVFGEETVFEAVSGQEWVFEVAAFQRELDAYEQTREDARERRPRMARREVARQQSA